MTDTSIIVNAQRVIGQVNRRLFGSFVEHLGRSIYDGIYEPMHPAADEDGFRTDVIELVRELGVSAIRYPGGNFVSGFKWEDSVGPREQRPTRLNLAWHSTESNEVGLHEFSRWLEKIGSELMLAINLGTRGVAEALELLEYTNIESGTQLADQRALNGHPQSFNVRMWCLGNEMDGPWQLGHRSAEDYGKLASQTAKALRQVDPELELVICGSSSAQMPTFGEWERVVLTHAFEDVDFISCHAYYEEKEGDLDSFMASAVNMDHFIDSVISTIDHVQATLGSTKAINISFDEWNVWYLQRFNAADKITAAQNWPHAPRLLEDVYTVADAVVVGSLLISLLKHADRVTSASLAQLVNVIAPIMTEPGGAAWRQTTYFPFALTSRLAIGTALHVDVRSPMYETKDYGSVQQVDAVATHDTASGKVAIFLVNRSSSESRDVAIDVSTFGAVSILETHTLNADDPYLANTLAHPERVKPQRNNSVSTAVGIVTVTLPPISWTAISLDTTS